MKYLVEVRKAKQDEKFLLRGHSGLTVEVAEAETRMEHSVILAEISETDFSEAVHSLQYRLNTVFESIDSEREVESVEKCNIAISQLQSAISILKHLST